MTLKDLLIQINMRFVFALLFIFLAVDMVSDSGWGLISLLCTAFAANDILNGARMLKTYLKIKDTLNKK